MKISKDDRQLKLIGGDDEIDSRPTHEFSRSKSDALETLNSIIKKPRYQSRFLMDYNKPGKEG
jgi:hypothetical protein